MKQFVQHPDIGLIEFCTRRGMRGISYCVSVDRVRITANPWLAASVFPLSAERVAWILASRQKLAQSAPETFRFTPETRLTTNRFVVRLQQKADIKSTFIAERTDHELTICYRSADDLDDDTNQLKIKHLVAYFLRIEAEKILPERLHALAKKHGFRFAQVRINGAQTRWGSCSAQRHINLSYHLMLLPDELIDFVLVHELCHTREMSHGPRFVQSMRAIFPNYDTLNAALKKQSTPFR